MAFWTLWTMGRPLLLSPRRSVSKKLSQAGACTQDAMNEIMNEEKKSALDNVVIKHDVRRKYFPRSYTPKQMQDTIIKLLEQWQRRRQRDQSR